MFFFKNTLENYYNEAVIIFSVLVGLLTFMIHSLPV